MLTLRSRILTKSAASESKSTSVGFISLGCAKNLVDSQIMAEALVANEIILCAPEDADIIVVNTCSFIHDAREESMEMILSACEQKQRGKCKAVLVAGCLPQRYRARIQEALPDVDAFIGIDQLNKLPEIVRRLQAGQHNIIDISPQSERLFDPDDPVVFSSGVHAYLKIAEGCNHRCAFCAIPGIRGRHRSRPIDKIVDEAQKLIKRGFSELDIISQDITFYGHELNTNLANLLRELGKIDGKFWLRLLYGYPTGITNELLDVIAATPQICNYLDIPIQHSHPDILTAMLRKQTINPVINMPEKIRSIIPDATIRTTCLVGFPGETESHFQHLLDFCKEARFDHLGAFIYSPEEGTPAYDNDDIPPLEIAQERYSRLMQQQQQISAEINRELIGTSAEILLEKQTEEKPSVWIGRTKRQAPEIDGTTTICNLPPATAPGTFVKATITAADNYDLQAE